MAEALHYRHTCLRSLQPHTGLTISAFIKQQQSLYPLRHPSRFNTQHACQQLAHRQQEEAAWFMISARASSCSSGSMAFFASCVLHSRASCRNETRVGAVLFWQHQDTRQYRSIGGQQLPGGMSWTLVVPSRHPLHSASAQAAASARAGRAAHRGKHRRSKQCVGAEEQRFGIGQTKDVFGNKHNPLTDQHKCGK